MNNQLKKLQEVIPPRAFVIPDYQRGYAWKEEHRRDLLDDLRDLAELDDEAKMHYTGTLVLHRGQHESSSGSARTYDVIDGQQRLTTLVILLSVIARRLDALNTVESRQSADRIRADYIGPVDAQKLTPFGDAAAFFRDHALGGSPAPHTGSPPEKAMLAAREQFERYIDERLSTITGPTARIEWLDRWTSLITTRLGFIVFEVDDEADVGVMFESMNARGKPLTQFELVKNFLLFAASRVTSGPALHSLTREINDTWRVVVAALDAAGLSDADDTLLRYHWWIWPKAKGLDNDAVWKTSNIHRAMKEVIRVTAGPTRVSGLIREYLTDLRRALWPFVDLSRPGHPKAFEGASANLQPLIDHARGIRRLGRTAVVTPLLMAASMQLGNAAPGLVEVVRLAETFVFRLALMEMKSNTGTAVMMGIARDIRGGALGAAAIHARLREQIQDYVPDKDAEIALLVADGSSPAGNFFEWGHLPHLLFEYERSLVENSGNRFVYDWTEFYKKWRESIEHILPQGDGTLGVAYWKTHFTPEQFSRSRHRLGNLTLTAWNPHYGNRGFDEKCGAVGAPHDAKVYRNSKFLCERELVSDQPWNVAAIDRRQKRIADFAMARWKA